MPARKLLLDTDIGSNIDDAVCLAYLLAQPECELLGITTVTGQPEKRAAIASALCQAASREVPIFPGVEGPLLAYPKQPQAPQASVLYRWPHREFPAVQAVDAIRFLQETIHNHPGEIDLLTIGPLTNVALLFTLDPEIPVLLNSLTMMCGHFAPSGRLEWNARLDPHACEIVLRAGVRSHRVIGLDVTQQVRMDIPQVRERFKIRPLRPVLDFAEVFFRERDTVFFHDPLAALTLFVPEVCTFEPGNIEVELAREELVGKTYWTPEGPAARHAAALQVNPQLFFDHFFSVFEP